MARMPTPAAIAAALLLVITLSLHAAEPPALMLATRWDRNADPTGWWMSEKYDGVRGYWDGANLWTREGTPIAIPDVFRAELPLFPLDGELWAGRGHFEETTATVRDYKPGPGWSAIRYMVFDAPGHAGPFEDRMAAIQAWLREHPSTRIEAVVQRRCEGKDQLRAFLHAVERRGGEGVVLRAAGSLHVPGRSDQLRKYKSFEDTEAVVRGYNPGQGKYAGMVGSLQMELPDGKRFSLGAGLTDRVRRSPPPVGSLVTFKHQGWTAEGRPRFPVYWRIRELPHQPEGLSMRRAQ